MSAHMISDERARGSYERNSRMFPEEGPWFANTGGPWRDLPKARGA